MQDVKKPIEQNFVVWNKYLFGLLFALKKKSQLSKNDFILYNNKNQIHLEF